jgi:hypothetical protein
MSEGVIDYLGQIMEEACIITIEDWKKGKENQSINEFLLLSLDFISLGLSKHFSDHVPLVLQQLNRINKRIEALS